MSNFVIETFTTKTNKVDLVDAAHMNSVQTSIVTIETALNILCTTGGALNQGTSFPGSPITGQLFYRTDLGNIYIYAGSAWATLAAASNIQIFTGSGTFTAPAGITKVYVTICGGGGGGGSNNGTNNSGGGGGGAPTMFNVPMTVIPGNGYTVTIGAGGAGTNNDDGANGGSSSFDTLSVGGGNGGKDNGNGRAGGAAANITTGINRSSFGGNTGANGATIGGNGGNGGGSAIGQGGTGGAVSNNGTDAAANTGAGGGGGGPNGGGGSVFNGGAGGSGICIVAY